jgi:hypothetical protein
VVVGVVVGVVEVGEVDAVVGAVTVGVVETVGVVGDSGPW